MQSLQSIKKEQNIHYDKKIISGKKSLSNIKKEETIITDYIE